MPSEKADYLSWTFLPSSLSTRLLLHHVIISLHPPWSASSRHWSTEQPSPELGSPNCKPEYTFFFPRSFSMDYKGSCRIFPSALIISRPLRVSDHEMILFYLEFFFYSNWCDHVVFILHFIDTLYLTDWFWYVKLALEKKNPSWWLCILFLICWIRFDNV